MFNANNTGLTVLLFTIIGTICWGISPIFVKLGLTNVNPLVGLFIRTSFALSLIISWIIFSDGFWQLKELKLTSVLLLIAEATVATFLGDLAYFTAVKYGNPFFVTAFMSTSPLITMFLSIIIFGEAVTLTKVIGILLIILGVMLIM